ncbi:hypothetical protein A2755_03790 [Candidatus Wolfebacteria bacterium RIFCSPHIGHO2_01_FULL_48_22]|uniref:HTH marR-type domain-containing protein n=2 Tax=Candidatus Wolfeibacteriota TaxID=1752735 RepID=A0A1F8DPF3_9BACT|nr:MAG: hypothetical protein A2755_03790 [Candidatus Wolfebacteria bacterium RIFCSPHIGHO2_01_FULL_48_22]OGM93463.1 MAG: hypothetical protein A2935_01140 [Candidatus Wolfebacteria bacterium RIFCSPLOWO2_01_FULL_47_17b]
MARIAQTAAKIIELLGNYPEREFYSEETAKRVKCSKASASVILRALAEKDIVSKRIRGHMRFYQINMKHPAVKTIKIQSAPCSIPRGRCCIQKSIARKATTVWLKR